MKCKKHLTTDFTSTIGVCATCLRERLLSLLAAQSDRRDSDPQPNISPNYNCRRKSHLLSDPKLRTESATHQTGHDCDGDISSQKKKKRQSRFSLFTSFFKPKSQKETHIDFPIPRPGDTMIASTSSSCSSPFWFSTKLSRHKDKQSRLFSVEEPIHQCVRFRRDRGMSPARVSDVGDDDDISNPNVLSQKTPESSKQTPSRASRRGGGQSCHSSTNVSGFSFCLSPLVRASPSRTRNQKGVLPELSFSGGGGGGDARSCGKPPLSMATKYCPNRSRKIADFGRLNHNH